MILIFQWSYKTHLLALYVYFLEQQFGKKYLVLLSPVIFKHL